MSITAILKLLVSCLKLISCASELFKAYSCASELIQLSVIFLLLVKFLYLNLNAPIAAKVVCFSRLLKCLRSLYDKQCGPRSDCSCSGSTLFAHILNWLVMLGNYLQQTTSANDIFKCFFFLGALRVNQLQKTGLLRKFKCKIFKIHIGMKTILGNENLLGV